MRHSALRKPVTVRQNPVSDTCPALKTSRILESMPEVGSELEAVRKQLERVLASPGFARNERLSRFLRFIVEQHLGGKDSELKESVIALEVFGRPDHDP